jgi:tRNA nucleotidyltransferase (CCA-adding enzyme)
MKVYLVGGAVRDELLGLRVRERDWVVVGADTAELTARGFRPVGKDFPVFLHPETAEEYALARTERKTRPGYYGFETRFASDVTLEEDLSRRDLTINAIAKDEDGTLIDPFGGRADLKNRVLRHVSPAFIEDPVRVLRLARFAARFAPLGFRVAPETLAMAQAIAANGELDALVAERVWQEMRRALSEAAPQRFFEVLRDAHALPVVFPELHALFGVPQPANWHPEIDTGVHTLMALEQAARLSDDPLIRFAALTHDLGKAATPREQWPSHHGHDQLGVALIERMCERLKIPNDYRELAVLAAKYHGRVHRILDASKADALDLLNQVDAFRRPARFRQFLVVCEADLRGRAGFENYAYPQADWLRRAYEISAAVRVDGAAVAQMRGAEIAEHIRAQRVQALENNLS